VPNLKYNLDRALFNPGVYQLQDFYSKVFNFDPYLGQIMPAEEFDYGALRQYVTSSKDTDLLNLTIEHKKKYTGSTSSMTSTLSHFHYLLSGFRPPNFDMLSHQFMTSGEAVNSFTRFTRAPVATFLHWKDGAYAIDADKEFDSETVLSLLGRSMEKLFTLDKKDHEKYRKSASGQLAGEAPPDPSVYHYTTIGDVLMRSQLDAHDERLPGTGMFDLKTRAVISVRMNIHNYKDGQGYEIRDRFGPFESFEREYYDMIRSAFLKYSLQARMGRMTGIYVAYHNTKRIFGFQYIPLSEMDHAVHGTRNMSHGDREYKASVHLLNVVLDKVTARFPEKTLRLFIEARPGKTPFMYIFAKPVSDKEVAEVQGKAQSKAERIALKMGDTSAKAEDEDNGEVALDDSTAIQESADASELREMLKADKRQKAIPKSSPAEKIEKTEKTEEASPAEEAEKTEEAEENKELLGLILSIRHKVNGKPVEPTSTDMFDDGAIWNIDYSIRGMAPSEANRNFQKLRNRRLQVYTSTQPGASTFNDEFREKLSRYNKRGISYRQRLNRQSEGRPVRV
ncbi:mitochondrial protein Pet127-domain-containing protein, partial [Cercophora newfieldiana]